MGPTPIGSGQVSLAANQVVGINYSGTLRFM